MCIALWEDSGAYSDKNRRGPGLDLNHVAEVALSSKIHPACVHACVHGFPKTMNGLHGHPIEDSMRDSACSEITRRSQR